MPTGTVFCSIERLYDWEGKNSGLVVPGITLSVGWDGTQANKPPNFCFPWAWLAWGEGSEKLGFQLAAIRVSDQKINLIKNPVHPQALTWSKQLIASLRQQARYQDLANSLQIACRIMADTQLTYTQNAKVSVDTQVPQSPYGAAPWPSVLADLSTRPAPIPHVLMLSFVLPALNTADLIPNGEKPEDWRLFAAPILPKGVVDLSAETPLSGNPALGADKITVIWPYTIASFLAQSESIGLGSTIGSHSFFDMSTRLVVAPGAAADEGWHFDEDWQSSLENRLAGALDLGAELLLLIERMGPQENTRPLADAAIAALRDIAGIGIDAAPSGRCLLYSLVNNFDDAFQKAVAQAVKNTPAFQKVADWKTFFIDPKTGVLNAKDSALFDRNLSQLAVWGTDNISPSDAASQLHKLRQKLLAPDMLWALLVKQIGALLPNIPDAKQKTALQSLKAPTDVSVLPAALRMENLGRYWQNISKQLATSGGKPYKVANLRDGITQALKTIAVGRFDASFSISGLPTISSDFGQVQTPLQSAPDWSKHSGWAIPPSPSVGPAAQNNGTGMAPQGITIQVNELDDPNGTPAPGEVAFVKKLQGVGMLLAFDETSGIKGWKCLNYADVYYRHFEYVNGKLQGTTKSLEWAVLVAGRFSYQNRVAVAAVTYNNEPLCAPGPLSRAAGAVYGNPGDVPSDVLWYQYASATNPYSKDIGITPLVCGRNYRPQPFLISTSGAVPKILTDGKSLLDLMPTLDAVSGLGDTWKKVEYRRLCGVGSLRLSDATGDTPLEARRNLNFPAIPKGVFPITATQAGQPLLLLVPATADFNTELPSSFSFAVRPPATDLLTWDRFVNGFQNGLAAKRADVITSSLKEANNNLSRDKNSLPPDLTIDDPAAVLSPVGGGPADYDSRFFVELVGEDGLTIKSQVVRFAPPGASSLSSVQAGPVFVQIKVGNTLTMETAANYQINVTIPAGKRAKLRMSVCVPSIYQSRFRPALQDASTSGYIQISPTELNVEVASKELPDAAALYNGLNVGRFDQLNGTAKITLTTTGLANQEFIQTAETRRQVWKWQGRQMDPVLPTAKDKDKWLVRQFGARTDYLRTAMPFQPPPKGAPPDRIFSFVEDLSSLLSSGDRAAAKLPPATGKMSPPSDLQLRGTYIRYGVQVESRYKPLLKGTGFTTGTGAGSWKDLYIPSRKLTDIKPPNLKLALPMTRNADGADAGPGIMVLLRGPWFQACGLGEALEARLTMVEAPEDQPGAATQVFYYQFGPDPILSGKPTPVTQTVNAGQSPPDAGWASNMITGPVGHSFDTVSDDQLFVNTSFVLDYPKVTGMAWKPWSLCQLQLRRVVYTLDSGGNAVRSASSDWTTPTWVQLLPDFDLFSMNSINNRFKGLTLLPDFTNKYFQLADVNGNVLPSPPTPGTGDGQFGNYMAITHFTDDVTGIPTQEAYDGLYQSSGRNWVPVGSSFAPIATAATGQSVFYRARVITVQRRPTANELPPFKTEDAFWEALFPTVTASSIPDSQRMRIVGVSRPIDMKNGPHPGC